MNRAKCQFTSPKVEFLGHIIDESGNTRQIKAIQEAPQPKNLSELKSFLGLLNYYGKFLPNLSSTLTPLYNLLKKEKSWCWGNDQRKSFEAAKKALQADTLLVHYDPMKPLLLACDASSYRIGSVLSHVMDSGEERPVAYASRTLSSAEKNYSQLEKEGLAIIFGVKNSIITCSVGSLL